MEGSAYHLVPPPLYSTEVRKSARLWGLPGPLPMHCSHVYPHLVPWFLCNHPSFLDAHI